LEIKKAFVHDHFDGSESPCAKFPKLSFLRSFRNLFFRLFRNSTYSAHEKDKTSVTICSSLNVSDKSTQNVDDAERGSSSSSEKRDIETAMEWNGGLGRRKHTSCDFE